MDVIEDERLSNFTLHKLKLEVLLEAGVPL